MMILARRYAGAAFPANVWPARLMPALVRSTMLLSRRSVDAYSRPRSGTRRRPCLRRRRTPSRTFARAARARSCDKLRPGSGWS
jgi:hypothetical protein